MNDVDPSDAFEMMLGLVSVDLPPEEVHEILGNKRRRLVIRRLARLEPNEDERRIVTVVNLARVVAADLEEVPADELSSEQRRRMYVSLSQQHIPALDDSDVLTYYDRTQKVEATRRVDQLAALTTAIESLCRGEQDGRH